MSWFQSFLADAIQIAAAMKAGQSMIQMLPKSEPLTEQEKYLLEKLGKSRRLHLVPVSSETEIHIEQVGDLAVDDMDLRLKLLGAVHSLTRRGFLALIQNDDVSAILYLTEDGVHAIARDTERSNGPTGWFQRVRRWLGK